MGLQNMDAISQITHGRMVEKLIDIFYTKGLSTGEQIEKIKEEIIEPLIEANEKLRRELRNLKDNSNVD